MGFLAAQLAAWRNIMRGVIANYDSKSQCGSIRTADGDVYPFIRKVLTRRSKEPRTEAAVVFRLRKGQVLKAKVISYKRQWEWVTVVAEVLLYLPIALAK